MHRVLWIDDDRLFLEAHVLSLELEGYKVDRAYTLSEAAGLLHVNTYSLVILDIMISVRAEEEPEYPPSQTEHGKKAGLVFFKRHIGLLQARGAKVLVFTIRSEDGLRDELTRAGLGENNFMTKAEGEDTAVFLKKVQSVLAGGGENA